MKEMKRNVVHIMHELIKIFNVNVVRKCLQLDHFLYFHSEED